MLSLVQQWGLIEDDAELSLILAPAAYLRASLHLWSDHLFAGAVTQSMSLYVPMGPFFALSQALGVPTWCTERIWLALLLTVGFWGLVRLAEALGIGRPYARVLAGLAYCITPIVLSWTTTTRRCSRSSCCPGPYVPWWWALEGGPPEEPPPPRASPWRSWAAPTPRSSLPSC